MRFRIIISICFTMTFFIANAQTSVQATIGVVNRATPKFGFNTNGHIPPNFPLGSGNSGANWTQQWFKDSTAYLNPEILRYPGGTNANHWDWQTGWYLPAYQPSGPSLTIRADEFKPGIQGCNGEGIYVVNMETSTAHYEMDGLRHAQSIGLTPNLIELGNEHNLNGGTQFPLQLMTPQAYSQLGKVYYDSIIAEFPTAKICAVGGNTPTIAHWVDSVLHYIPTIDALSFHVYINANNASDQAFNVNRALAEPFRIGTNPSPSLDYRYNLSGFPSNKEVWVTEFNLLESPSGIPQIISQTWTHVLFNVAMNHYFLGKSNVSMILNHSLAGDNHFQSISRQDKKITANALSMKLLYDMSRGSTSCQNINFSGNPAINYGTTTIPKLIGWKFNYLGMEKGFICNFSKDTFALSLATVFANPMQFDQYFADTTVIVNGITSLSKYSANSSDTIIVYPYSITQINSVIATGIQNFETIKNELWIYPNPANRNINIRTEINLNNADVFIYDISGKEVIQLNKISGNSFLLSLDKLNSGVYFVKINSNNKTTTGKFIVD
jgi:hypothetical protein